MSIRFPSSSMFALRSLCLLLITASATAEATHPALLPPTSAKGILLATPVPLSDALMNGTIGLDRESPEIKRLTMQEAHEYVQLRKSRSTSPAMRHWLEKCQNLMNENVYCRYEMERTSLTSNPKSSSTMHLHRHELAEWIKAGEFDRLAHQDHSDIVSALSSIGDAAEIQPIAQKAANIDHCVPAELTSTLGNKMEELFPAPEAIELAKKLYQKSADCGLGLASGVGAFRLGLILVWQNQCQNVPALMEKTEHIAEAQQFHARAKYWSYHCANSSNDNDKKTAAKNSLLKDYPMSFQNLAANGSDDGFAAQVLNDSVPNVAMRSLIRPDVNAYLRGAEALAKAGSPHLAAEMLDRNVTEIATLEPEVRLYTAAFLNHIGYSLTTFKVLSNLFQDAPRMVSKTSMKLFFPLSYIELVKTKEKQIDPLLILSLIRQESAFNPEARSSVGARGLMQVMPATARSIASVNRSRLFVPEVNVGVGTKYFLKQLSHHGGDVELTLAAYNAGMNRVETWLKRYPTDNKLLFLDFIPFKETRDYVSSILRNYYWYVQIYSEQLKVAKKDVTPSTDLSTSKVRAIMAANAGVAAGRGNRAPASR